jgi:TolB-like protein
LSEQRSLWTELRARHVVRAAVAHLVFFWLLAQIAETVLPYIGIVDETVRWAVVAGVALFPVTLIVAWFFEHPWHRVTSSRVALDIAIIAVITVAAGSWVLKNIPQAIHARTSIVVLPFTHDAQDLHGKGLSKALAYEINSLLMKSNSIDVVGYESATSTVLDGLDALAAASRLGVQHVLSGVISSTGNSLRVSVKLRSQSGHTVWTSAIEDQLDNLYSVQEQIASGVQTHLGFGNDLVPVSRLVAERCHMPVEQSALERYYTARHYVESRTGTEQSVKQQYEAVAMYEGLLEEYPDFAQASSGLAWALLHLTVYDPENNQLDVTSARADGLAKQALQVCQNLGEALVALENEADHDDNDWINWDQKLRLWIELQPEATENHQKYIRFLSEAGRTSDARRIAEKNYALNPLSVRSIKNLSYLYQSEERFDEAIALAEEAKALGSTTPDFARRQQQMSNCDFDIECVLDEFTQDFQPMRDQIKQIYTPPENVNDLDVKLQIAADLLDQNPWAVNWANGSACWYDHLTPLFFQAWEFTKKVDTYWYWPNVWMKSCGNIWESDMFPAFAEDAGLLEYWRDKGWPDACQPVGESVECSEANYQSNISR